MSELEKLDISRPQLTLGLYGGLLVAIFLSFLVLILRLAGDVGGSGLPSGLTYGELILIYFVACPLGGLIFGLFLPMARWLIGSMILGMLVIFPLLLGQTYFASTPPGEESLDGAVVAAVLLGSFLGAYGWTRWVKEDDTNGDSHAE